jgi:hypothetical protein
MNKQILTNEELKQLQKLCDNIHFPNVDSDIYKSFKEFFDKLMSKYTIPQGYTINIKTGKLLKIRW